MRIVRIGETILNLKYLISAQRWKGGPDSAEWRAGDVMVTMERGEPIRFPGDEGDLALRTLGALAEPIEPLPPRPAPGTPLDQGRIESVDDPTGPIPDPSSIRSAENGG
jgi:hypothetical protein